MLARPVLSSPAGVSGLLYVTTGVHGGHVLLGMLLLLCYEVQSHRQTWMGVGSICSILRTAMHVYLQLISLAMSQ